MTSKDTKTVSERAVEAQANKTDLATELGLSKDEIKIITAYCGLLQKRIDLAPVEPVLGAVELHIQKKFPNNSRAQDEIDTHKVDDSALKYVEDSAIGYPAGNLEKPAPIDNAKSQVARASTQMIASPDDQDRQVSYAKSVRWLAQMQVQGMYKEALNPVFQAVHQIHRGYKWTAPDKTNSAAITDDESLAVLMA